MHCLLIVWLDLSFLRCESTLHVVWLENMAVAVGNSGETC